MAGALPDAAVHDGLVLGCDEAVELLKLLATAEPPGLVDRLAPRNVHRGGDMTGTQHAFLRVVGHMGALTGVLLGERTSISGWRPRLARTSSLKARIGASLRGTTG